MINHLYHKIKFTLLKKKLKKNPYLGEEDTDGTYVYKQGPYSMRYRIVKKPEGLISIEWLQAKRRLSGFEEGIRKINRSIFKFQHYQGWLIFLRPPIIFLLIASIIIFYFGLVETEKTKVSRLKWVVASVVGINPDQIQYIGDGWLEISAKRKTAVDRISEPIRYTFNPFRWLFFSEGGLLTRWRGQTFGHATHPVVYNERGDVWINKEGTWRYGKISGETIKWDTPQGTGIRAGKVAGHEISTPEKKLFLPDTKKK